VQGKGLVPTFSASQKTWQRPPAQGVAPRPHAASVFFIRAPLVGERTNLHCYNLHEIQRLNRVTVASKGGCHIPPLDFAATGQLMCVYKGVFNGDKG